MPNYFNNIIGNKKLKSMLSSYLENNSLAHAFIIEGPVGSGRKTIANSIIAAKSCKNAHEGILPCGRCINCEKIFKKVCPDVINIDSGDKQTIGIDIIRELNSHTYMSPNELDMKAYIIDGADKMTVAAQNAFLKTLEEPATEVMYFLICENAGQMLQTVISRAPVLRTAPLSDIELVNELSKRIPEIDTQKAKETAKISRGNLGVALKLATSSELSNTENDKRNDIYKFISILKNKNSKLDLVDYFTLQEKNYTDIERLRLIYSALRDIIAYKESDHDKFDFFLDREELKDKCAAIKPRYAKKICALIESAIAELELNQGQSSADSVLYLLALNIRNAKN